MAEEAATHSVMDPLPQLTKAIETAVKEELKDRFNKKQLSQSFGRKNLESVLSPVIGIRAVEGKTEGLMLSLLCETTTANYSYIISRLNNASTEFAKYCAANGIETNAYLLPMQTRSLAQFTTDGRDKTSKKILYSVTFTRDQSKDFTGSLSFYISNELASKPDVAKKFFIDVWKEIILDKDRLALYNDDKEMENLGLQIFKSKLRMEAVGGYEEVKKIVYRDVFYPFLHRNKLDEIIKETVAIGHEEPSKAVLFYGVPGSGKTLTARAISNRQGMTFFFFSISNMYSKWYGESAQKLTQVLDFVERYSKRHGKTVLFLDELDSIGRRGGDSGVDMENSRVINTLLVRLDGLSTDNSNKNLLVIGATNNYDALDPALLSRFSSKVFFDKPSKEDREKIWALYAKHLSKPDLEILASKTEGLVGRDIKMVAGIARGDFCMDLDNGIATTRFPEVSYYLNAIPEFGKKKSPHSQPQGLYS